MPSIISSISLGLFGITGVTFLMLRWLFRSHPPMKCNCHTKPGLHAVITGATSGLGRATSLALAHHKWRLTLACRDMTKANQVCKEIAESTNNPDISVEYLDLTERQSINEFVENISKNPIHVLINNAGVMASTPRPIKSFGYVNVDAATNYIGTFYLTHLLLPFLRKYPTDGELPRIVFVSSSLASKGSVANLLEPWSSSEQWNTQRAYANSKLACCLLARELHRRHGTSANVYCLFTGGMVNTQLSRDILSQYSAPVRWILKCLSGLVMKTPEEGCQSIVHCAVSSNVSGAHTDNQAEDGAGAGLLYRNCVPIPWPPTTEDVINAKLLWDETLNFLDIQKS